MKHILSEKWIYLRSLIIESILKDSSYGILFKWNIQVLELSSLPLFFSALKHRIKHFSVCSKSDERAI